MTWTTDTQLKYKHRFLLKERDTDTDEGRLQEY